MRARLTRSALRLFGLLPRSLRRLVIRAGSPSWTAGTLAIVERADGRWLLVRPAYRRGWALPGGLLRKGERPEPAIHRELAEELGLAVVVDPEPWALFDARLRRLDIVWRARPAPGFDPDSVTVRSPELLAVGWFDPDTPPRLEDEAHDVLVLRRRVLEGGPSVLVV
ncbi:MAG: NUDIX hydrolase [Actinomyces sp.]|nr:MAG: NUDIX hydrolase [Actinomyces sp.]